MQPCAARPRAALAVWFCSGPPAWGRVHRPNCLASVWGHASSRRATFCAAKTVPESDRSPAMAAALVNMSKGELVPDATVLEMVRETQGLPVLSGRVLLDGFPRTVAQAEALAGLLVEVGVKLDAVIDFRLPIDEIVARLSGRRTCVSCKSVFHVTGRPPKVDGVCDRCGSQLVQREDDRPESVRVRMQATISTPPLTDYFQKKGLLVQVDAHGAPEEIFQRTLKLLAETRVQGNGCQ